MSPGVAVSWWMLSKPPSSSCTPFRCCPLRLHGMRLGLHSTAKELEHPLWSRSADRKSFEMESEVV